MTRTEFDKRLAPIIAARWPRMVGKAKKGSSEFEIAMANEINDELYHEFERFSLEQAVTAVRDYYRKHPGVTKQGYAAVRKGIIALLVGNTANKDPARWTWTDELDLWHHMAKFAKSLSTGVPFGFKAGHFGGIVLGQEWEDETYVARQCVGKNPSLDERAYAYKILCNQIDDSRKRMMDRDKLMLDEAERMLPYPRNAYWELRHKWSEAEAILKQRQEMAEALG